MKLSLIVAMDRNGLIGRDGGLPWPRIAEDMRLFRELTMGEIVVVGRKTWDDLPDGLPGRCVAVVARRGVTRRGYSILASGPDGCVNVLAATNAHKAIAIGGAETYATFRDLFDEAHVTLIDGAYEGDTHFPFPLLDSPEWEPAADPRVLTAGVTYHHLRRVNR